MYGSILNPGTQARFCQVFREADMYVGVDIGKGACELYVGHAIGVCPLIGRSF